MIRLAWSVSPVTARFIGSQVIGMYACSPLDVLAFVPAMRAVVVSRFLENDDDDEGDDVDGLVVLMVLAELIGAPRLSNVV